MNLKKPVKITADTNILISMYVFPGGLLAGIMKEAEAGGCVIGTSEPVIKEMCLVLQKKFKWPQENIERLAAQLRRRYTVVEPGCKIEACKADPTDDKIPEAAVEFGADYILSGDRHLLEMKKYRGISIIKPAELIKVL